MFNKERIDIFVYKYTVLPGFILYSTAKLGCYSRYYS